MKIKEQLEKQLKMSILDKTECKALENRLLPLYEFLYNCRGFSIRKNWFKVFYLVKNNESIVLKKYRSGYSMVLFELNKKYCKIHDIKLTKWFLENWE